MSMRSLWCWVVVGSSVLLGIACGDSTNAPTATSQEAIVQTATVTIRLPATLVPSSVVLGADGALRLADRVTVPASGSAPTAIANAGTTETNVGADARVRDVWSRASVVLRDRARVDGAARSEGTITKNAGVVVTGPTVEHAVLSPPSVTSWTVTLPSSDSGDVTLAPGATRNLAPGSYRNLTVYAGATLTLNPGTYFFQAIAIEPQGVVRLNSVNGPIVVYARAGLTFRGVVSDPQGRAELLLVALGSAPVVLDQAFTGTIVAPQASLTLSSATHTGAFFGKDVDVRPDARIVSKPFPSLVPGTCTGAPDNTSCTDQNACTTNDRCKKGQCQGTPVVCPATGNACVGAFCDAATGSCLKTALEGKPCNDGNASTTGEMCLGGLCLVPSTPDAFCGSETGRAISFTNDPNAWQATRAVAEASASYQALASTDEESLAFTDFIVIPVVFHVLENPAIPRVENPQIFDLMDDLNRFFRNVGTTGVLAAHTKFASAPRIQFELAKRGPTCGDATDGIHRVPTATREFVSEFFGTGGPVSSWAVPPQGVPAWDPRKYLNIWIVSYRPGNVPATGFFNEIARARFPERHGMPDDGIALTVSPDANFTVFSFPAENILAHEVGHYFDLRHVDQPNDAKAGTPQPQTCNGGTAATCATEGDLVCDTPAMFRPLPGCNLVNNCADTPADQPDQTENIMGSESSSCHNLWTFGQVDRMESALATARASLLASDGNLPPETSADAWIRDGEGDLGQQPNDLEVMWASDDLWVRRQADGRTVQQHQNPVFRTSDPNRVYVRVRNKGCQQAESTNVTLYWAKASASLAWPTPWNGTEVLPNGAPLGDAVGTQPTGVIPPGGSVVLEFAWSPQNPALYSSIGGDATHFCLLANIGAAPGAQDLYQLVKSRNDTAWKNVTVTTETSASEETAAVGVDGRRGDRQRLTFSEVSSPASPGTLFEWGRVVVDLGPGLFARWVEGGRQSVDIEGEGIVGTRIPLRGSGAQLRNLPLQPGDHFTMNVIVEPLISGEFETRGGLDVYELEVTQSSEATNPVTPVGGQRFVLKTSRPPSFIPE